jgi:hypothetical protein
MPQLTPYRRELFAHNAIKAARLGESQRWAYRQSGYRCSAAAADVAACRLLKDAKVQARIAELSRPAIKRAQVSLESLLNDLAADRQLARERGRVSAAIRATEIKARICGFMVKREEHPGSFDRSEALYQIERRHGREVRDLLAAALAGDAGS